MPIAPRVLAVCVNWNGGDVLESTLAGLRASTYPNLDVMVVDNASTDQSPEQVQPPARLLRLPHNLGYAAAVNRALAPCRHDPGSCPDYFLVLNNDVRLQPETVTELVDCGERNGAGVYGPQVRLQEDPSRLEAAWGEVVWNHVLARFRGQGRPAEAPPWSQPRRVQLLLGCALMLHRDVVLQVGAWDEKYFMYHEEVDYLYRAGQLGYPAFYCPEASVLHLGGHSTRRRPLLKTYWLRRNTVYFFRKHGAGLWRWINFGMTLTASLMSNLAIFRWRRAGAIWRGAVDGFRMRVDRS